MASRYAFKYRYLIFTLFLLVIFSKFSLAYEQCGFKCLQNQHRFGMIATSSTLDEIENTLPQEPPLSETGKSLVTYNKMGFDVLDAKTAQESFLVRAITQYSKSAIHPLLEIGGGYGRLSKIMLEQGATVIENDLELRHLVYGRRLVTQELREHLYLNTHRFPQSMILEPNSLSGVVLSCSPKNLPIHGEDVRRTRAAC